MRKTFEKLVTDCLCYVPCCPAKYAFIVIFIYDILCLADHCNSFFSAAKSSWELQTARSFLIVIVLSSMTGRSQSHSFLLFLSGEKWRFDLLRGEWNNLIECVLLFASCSFTSVALKYRQITSVWTLVSATVLVNLLFTSKLCFSLFSLFWQVYISLFNSNTYSWFFFGEIKKKLYLYWANYNLVIRISSLMRVDLFLNEFWVLYQNLWDKKSSPHFDVSFVIFKERTFLDRFSIYTVACRLFNIWNRDCGLLFVQDGTSQDSLEQLWSPFLLFINSHAQIQFPW